jgi:hypothetical protein
MSFVRLLTLTLVLGGLPWLAACCRKTAPPVVARADFHGWESIALRNPVAEAVVVPAIGRIMRFGLRVGGGDAPPGPFWSHPNLTPTLGADENGWINYGGDKTWPAPQSAWPAIAGRGWPPPKTFDAVPYAMSIEGNRVRLVSPVDPLYGIRVTRAISIDPAKPILTVETTYDKTQGAPVRVGVWSITQLEAPDRLFVRLPERSSFPGGYALLLPAPPRDLRTDGRLLSLARDPTQKTMIGSDGDALLWIGRGLDLLIENVTVEPADAAARWPDGVHAQVYTSPGGSESYVELELLGRLRDLRPGERTSMTVRYTLAGRVETDPDAEARTVFGPGARLKAAESPAGTAP